MYGRGLLWVLGGWLSICAAAFGDERHEQGRELYNYRCYYCHGYSGDAKTLAASYMTPAPRDFASTSLDALSRERMIEVVTRGVEGTAMKGFTYYLSPVEIELVVDFVREEFMAEQRVNTLYHTVENGWPDHDRYRIAYPFATGELPIDMPQTEMNAQQRKGLRLFLTSCVSCHDRGRVEDEGAIWELRAISYPRNNFSFTQFDGTTSASVYAEHDQVPRVAGLSEQEKQGEVLFQENCAFCHAADGTGKNWIGSFLDAKPRNLTDPEIMQSMTDARLRTVIEEGLVGTSMPAWKAVLSSAQIDALVSYISRVFHPVADDPVQPPR
nr:cytochrome c [Motiliproteus sediminis]